MNISKSKYIFYKLGVISEDQFGAYLVVIRKYSDLCFQKSLLLVLRTLYEILLMKKMLSAPKTSPLSLSVSLDLVTD